MRINYHVHNGYSSDGRGTTEQVVQTAFDLGFDEICFTNHAEQLSPEGGDWSLDLVEARQLYELQQQEIERLQPVYPELRILLGAELEYRPEWVETLDALVDSVDFDLIIGSVHVVDGHQISGGSVGEYFKKRDASEAYGRYFELLEEMVDWAGFDVVGHFDLVKRFGTKFYGPFDAEPFESQIRSTLDKMVGKGIGLEVNTSGVVQPPAEPYPGLDILRHAAEARIATVTIGSDSHVPTSFEQGIEVGERALLRAGFGEITLFSHRIRKNVPLDLDLEEDDKG
ncbi:MAG: histidinol-phosphatase [Gemmatimonadetes bacterium]|uniref:Histidinol-phosphatase n=1 Tax=Candidatus Kutchimonas denitrificans TaxID=3056748 RepID=A0AAE4Z9N5_9BACT|nr:histidinol-phosphatase [Gemmatimonadota bacterium]NIR74721.1 histidinol-phosphatase [Candidatus Kutchimonas denitrificans]NIS01471.1 histidinol-phosphatase [Gemmatimonadota bacterium]NIT67212.1 histidinol-phosphatase [Gemmatimonadota bacterium]NIU52386.1 histidinol-phosphatase HisJ family protein [Gemmatimonadota bacterium]